MKLQVKFFEELTTRELYEIVRSRTEIFLLEQHIICQDFDRMDYEALHCFLEKDGKVLAYLRAFQAGEGIAKVGRVLSITHGMGYGTKLMTEALPYIREKLGVSKVVVHAQKTAQGYYDKLGFVVTSDDYLEEGIPHVTMELSL
ncbi:MAG: GNAT family N-acetyltransferase [Ruminococcaceae bacterium]|nr:GNAT family N-acetyltransferase [Oscillospiraceae bacterium]